MNRLADAITEILRVRDALHAGDAISVERLLDALTALDGTVLVEDGHAYLNPDALVASASSAGCVGCELRLAIRAVLSEYLIDDDLSADAVGALAEAYEAATGERITSEFHEA